MQYKPEKQEKNYRRNEIELKDSVFGLFFAFAQPFYNVYDKTHY